MHIILFYNKFVICLYMFRALCVHHQEFKIVLYSNKIVLYSIKIVLYSIWYHHTYRCCRWAHTARNM